MPEEIFVKVPGFSQGIFRIMYPLRAGHMIFITKPLHRGCAKNCPPMIVEGVFIMSWKRISHQLLSSIFGIGIPIVHEIAQRCPLALPSTNLLKGTAHCLRFPRHKTAPLLLSDSFFISLIVPDFPAERR